MACKVRIGLCGRQIMYDTDYGCDRRHGWSTCIDGHFTVELAGFWRALWSWLTWRPDAEAE